MKDHIYPKKEPVFILCIARSGSTLLRYILDTHEDIFCPPELHLIHLMEQLGGILTILDTDFGQSEEERKRIEQEVYGEVRIYVDRLMRSRMKDSNKIWCEKSIKTIGNLGYVKNIFPNASYICLHRHCLDFVHSAMEVSRYGVFGYDLDDVIAKKPSNIVEALIDFWCETTTNMLSFEAKYKHQCFRVKYETVVNETKNTISKLFEFLDLEFDPQMLNNIFSAEHQAGPGDQKIRYTKKIEKTSVGNGYKIPLNKIGKNALSKMNSLLMELGYEEVKEDWNKKIPYHLMYNRNGNEKYFINMLKDIFEGELYQRLLKNKHYFENEVHKLKFVVKDILDGCWLIDFNELQIKKANQTSHADCSVIMDFEVLLGLLNKRSNIYVSLSNGSIEIAGNSGVADSAAYLFF